MPGGVTFPAGFSRDPGSFPRFPAALGDLLPPLPAVSGGSGPGRAWGRLSLTLPPGHAILLVMPDAGCLTAPDSLIQELMVCLSIPKLPPSTAIP